MEIVLHHQRLCQHTLKLLRHIVDDKHCQVITLFCIFHKLVHSICHRLQEHLRLAFRSNTTQHFFHSLQSEELTLTIPCLRQSVRIEEQGGARREHVLMFHILHIRKHTHRQVGLGIKGADC